MNICRIPTTLNDIPMISKNRMFVETFVKTECLLKRLLGLFPRIFLKTIFVGSGGSTIDYSDCISFVWLRCWDGVEG